ncbi:CSM1-like protein [Scheffersomyces xylosifermentans]|uniref:CSM1-like protein n=1 Tax=Scheffersomyces xylosifermentans TaxID=1304137 RepID=UPI00315C9ED5
MGPKTRKSVQKPVKTSKSTKETIIEEELIVPATRTRKLSAKVLENIIKPEDVRGASTPTQPKKRVPSSPSTSKRVASSGPISTALSKKLKASHPIITEQDILSSDNSQELVELINGLVNSKQDEIFTKYKNKVQTQLDNDHRLIQDLNTDLLQKESTIEKLKEEIEQLKKAKLAGPNRDISIDEKESLYESPIRKKKTRKVEGSSGSKISPEQLTKEFENIGFTLDMLELLTGLRIVNFEEDDLKYYFDVKQSSSSTADEGIYINYQLVISKSFESTAEIRYIPTFLEALDSDYDEDEDDGGDVVENAKSLRQILPEYLCENLSFPYNTLSQFYGKVSRALNKRK